MLNYYYISFSARGTTTLTHNDVGNERYSGTLLTVHEHIRQDLSDPSRAMRRTRGKHNTRFYTERIEVVNKRKDLLCYKSHVLHVRNNIIILCGTKTIRESNRRENIYIADTAHIPTRAGAN